MAVIGFIFMCIVGLYLSFFTIMCMWNSWGKYNIGGVPNSLMTKLSVFIPLGLTFAVWYYTFTNSPFSIIVN